jgi:integrase
MSNNRGKTRQLKLADERDVTPCQAEVIGRQDEKQIAMEIDPVENKKSIKLIPTFGDFIKDSYMPYVEGYKKSWKIDEGQLSIHVLPHWRSTRSNHQVRCHQPDGHLPDQSRPPSSNRLLILIRYIFNLAIRWEISGVKTNPTSGYQLQKVNNKRSRYMTHDEVKALYKELLCSQNKMLQYIVPMLILTGCRKREVLDAKWEDIDMNQRSWHINDTKSGYARHIPLSDGAIKVLNSVPRFNCKWVFPIQAPKNPMSLYLDLGIRPEKRRARAASTTRSATRVRIILGELRQDDIRSTKTPWTRQHRYNTTLCALVTKYFTRCDQRCIQHDWFVLPI